MRRAGSQSKGYTIIEIMIVLAVSGFMLASAAVLLRGQSTETTFQQSLRDIESKIQDVANSVTQNLYPNADKYTCSASTGTAVLTAATGDLGTNDSCLFLGRAIKAVTGKGKLYIYSVL